MGLGQKTSTRKWTAGFSPCAHRATHGVNQCLTRIGSPLPRVGQLSGGCRPWPAVPGEEREATLGTQWSAGGVVFSG